MLGFVVFAKKEKDLNYLKCCLKRVRGRFYFLIYFLKKIAITVSPVLKHKKKSRENSYLLFMIKVIITLVQIGFVIFCFNNQAISLA